MDLVPVRHPDAFTLEYRHTVIVGITVRGDAVAEAFHVA
jgi:hypothetical protein